MPTHYLLYGVPHWNKLITLTFVQGLGLIELDQKKQKNKNQSASPNFPFLWFLIGSSHKLCVTVRKRGQKEGYCLVPKSCNSLVYHTPGSSIYGISQARILEWVALSFFRGSSRPRVQTHVSYIGRWILYHWATREAPVNWLKKHNFSYHREEFIR